MGAPVQGGALSYESACALWQVRSVRLWAGGHAPSSADGHGAFLDAGSSMPECEKAAMERLFRVDWWRWREDSRPPCPSPAWPSIVRRPMLASASCLRSRTLRAGLPRSNTKTAAQGDCVCIWWRWRESNPRPKVLHPRIYMLSSPLDLVRKQHDVRSAPPDQPVLVKPWLTGSHHGRFRDNDPTSTSTGTSGFGAYALSGESVVVVVGN